MALSIANPSDLTGLKPHDHAHLNGCRFARADDILFTKEANDSISRHAQLGEEGLSPTKPQRPPVQLLLERLSEYLFSNNMRPDVQVVASAGC